MQGSTWARGRPPAPSVPGQGLPPLGPLPSSPRLSSPLAALASPSPSSAPPPCGLPNALSPAELLPPLCTGVHTLQTLSEGLSNAEALTDPNVHQPQPGEGCSRSPAGPSIHPPATGPSKGWVSWAAREQPGRWGTRGGGWRSSGSKPATSQPRMNECVFPSQHLARGHSECPRRLQKDLGFPQSSPTGGRSRLPVGTPLPAPPQPHLRRPLVGGGLSPGPRSQIHSRQTHKHQNNEGTARTSRPLCSSGSPPACLQRRTAR